MTKFVKINVRQLLNPARPEIENLLCQIIYRVIIKKKLTVLKSILIEFNFTITTLHYLCNIR